MYCVGPWLVTIIECKVAILLVHVYMYSVSNQGVIQKGDIGFFPPPPSLTLGHMYIYNVHVVNAVEEAMMQFTLTGNPDLFIHM